MSFSPTLSIHNDAPAVGVSRRTKRFGAPSPIEKLRRVIRRLDFTDCQPAARETKRLFMASGPSSVPGKKKKVLELAADDCGYG